MEKVLGLIGAIVVVVFGGGAWLFFGGDVGGDIVADSIKVASFNGEIFGDAKISNVGVDYYVDLVSDYDLFFLLEIRDIDNSSFYELCDALVGYECYLSNRLGRTRSKESVGVFVKDGFDVSRLEEYVDDSIPLENESFGEGSFERTPVSINVAGIRFWAVHLAPDDVYREMESLEEIVGDDEGKVVVLGDMNADCDYYSSGVDFDSWNWVIGDDADTASGFKDCAYDRIIVSSGVEVLGSGVVEIDSRVSDHNLVWVEIGGD